MFKLEDAVSGLPELGKESTVSHSGSGSWEELCFDFSGDVAGFSSRSITFIFDLGTLGDAENNPEQWTFFFDEITQVTSCAGGGADPGIIPDAVVYASNPNVNVDLPPPVVDDLGSGSTFDFFFAGDADFNPALRVRSGGDTGGGIDGNIAVNGGFETGTFDGWQPFPNNGVLAVVTDNPSSGTFAANLLVPVRAEGDQAADPLIKNANLQAGSLTPGAEVTVSFDMRGTLSGAGGVVFAELFSELAGEGVSKAEILSGGPLTPTAGWTTHSFTTTLGPDVSGGVTLQLKASCGPVEGCGVDAFIDNVSIVIGTGGVATVNGAGDFSIMSATSEFSTLNSTDANVGVIALTGYAPGFAAGFETFNFKVKGLPAGTIEVRFIEGGDTSRVYDVNTFAGSTSLGNGWFQLSIPLTDFAATIASNQGFVLGPLGEQAVPFAFLLTDIGFSGTAGGGDGGGDVGDNIVVNGGFETGTFDGWETFPGGGTQAIVTDNPSSGTYAANLSIPVRGPTDAGIDNLIKNSNLQAGNLTPGAPVTVSFDMRGSLAGAGGVVFAEFFSELSGGGTSAAEILGGGPIAPTADWTKYSFNTTLGADVSGGVTLQLKVSCGPVDGCGVDVFFDNVSIVLEGGVVPPPPTGDGVAIDFGGAGPFNFVDFEGGVATVVDNPDPSGINTGARVARMQKFEGAPFAGSTLPLASVVDFSAGPAFTMKVWSARPVPVTFKLEGLGQERVANHSGGSVWQELCFDFTGLTAGMPANGITFIFDNGVPGDAQNDPAN
ncbi:MAG: carbohydrate binding domain-containing protein, partial [Wenzhouxiangella sp.]